MWLFGRKKKKAKEEAERKAREEAEAKRLEEERLEQERLAKEEAERKAKEEAIRKAKEAEAKAKEEETKKEAPVKEEVEPKESTQEIKVAKPAGKKIYHVVKRPKDNKWCVKIEGSDRAIKLFDTKPEALAYSEKLAANQDGTLRVHASKGKNKGKIQANK